MTAETASKTFPARLRRNVLDLPQVVFQGITAYHTTNVEDGVALADEAARADLAARYPEAWARIARRREFMADRLGIRLRPEVLPLSDLAGYLPPYWLAPVWSLVGGSCSRARR